MNLETPDSFERLGLPRRFSVNPNELERHYLERSRDAFAMIKDHVLLGLASSLQEADAKMTEQITPEVIDCVVKLIPDSWLLGNPSFSNSDQYRDAYIEYLVKRLEQPRRFLEEAIRARS